MVSILGWAHGYGIVKVFHSKMGHAAHPSISTARFATPGIELAKATCCTQREVPTTAAVCDTVPLTQPPAAMCDGPERSEESDQQHPRLAQSSAVRGCPTPV